MNDIVLNFWMYLFISLLALVGAWNIIQYIINKLKNTKEVITE